jgi:uncharacterized protein YycO
MQSKIIKYHSRGEYSHAAMIFGDCIIEAWADRIFPPKGEVYQRPLGFGHTKGTEIDVFRINPKFIDESKVENANNFLLHQVGKGYDFKMVFAFITRRSKEGRSSTDKWFCSELAYVYMEKLGVPLFKRTNAWEITPDMLKRLQVLEYKYKTIPKVS